MKEPWTPGCQRQQLPNFSYLQYTSVSRVKSLDPDSTKAQWTPGCPWQQLPTLLTYNIRVSQEWSHLILIVRRSNGHLVALNNSCQLYLLIIYECLKSEVTWSWEYEGALDTWLPTTTVAKFTHLQYTSVSRVKSLHPDSTKEQWTPGCPRQQLPTLLTYNIQVSQEWRHLILIVRRSNRHLVALENSCQLFLLIIYECLKSAVTWSW